MSINTKINPARMEMITSMLFGRKTALTIMANNPSLKEYSLKRLEELYGKPKEKIGTEKFKVETLVADTETICDAFGFDRSNLRFVGGDNAKFKKVLDTIDALMGFVLIFPSDQIEDVKSGIRLVAKTISQYVPDFKSIGKMLAIAPGISKYSKILITFGESMDKAVSILNRGGDDCVRDAINAIRDGIKSLYDVDIEDINKQVSGVKDLDDNTDPKSKKKSKKEKDGDVIDCPDYKVIDNAEEVKSDSSSNKNKKEDKKMITSDDKSDAIAFNQQMAPMPSNGMSAQPNMMEGSYIPEFMTDGLEKVQKSVPEFMSENDMKVPKADFMNRIFQPITQEQGFVDPRILQYQFISEIVKIANSLGYRVSPELIVNNANIPVLIYIRTYNSSNGAFLQDKSFIIDLGVMIDKRFGIWGCATPDGGYTFLEFCDKAYALFTDRTIDKNGKKEKVSVLNTSFLEKLFKFGFTNLDGSLEKGDILYGERMIVTNRRIDLSSMPDLSKDARNIIKGGCIRAATALDAGIGRLRFKSVNPETLEFVLTTEGVSPYFMAPPIVNSKPIDVFFTPALDEQGHRIPVNPKGGSDIKYTVTYNG